MDAILENGNLLLVDYIKLKEFSINQNKGLFLKTLWEDNSSFYKTIAFKLNYYSILKKNIFSHPYSLCYSSSYFVDYRNNIEVSNLEAEADKKYIEFEECNPNKSAIYYFLNPILYKSFLGRLDKVAALLYFTAGVKSSARFNKLPHIKKFIPSNGARYPFKILIFIKNENIAPLKVGIYEYDMKSHALVKKTNEFPMEDSKSSISIIYFADITRVINRYPSSIFYRDLLFDYGHLIGILRNCVKHYGIGEFLKITEFIDNDFEIKKEKNLLELPFLQLDFTLDLFN